jgi:photosystem II stability/assembly factor-like uncharacterized protein
MDPGHRTWPCRSVNRLILSVRVGLVIVVAAMTLIVDVDRADAHSPHDDVGDIAVSPAYAEDRTVFAIVRGRLMRSTNGGSAWVEIVHGVGGATQTLARVAVAPSDERVVYLTSRGDGVLKSEDGGTTWQLASRGLTNLNLQEMTVSPVSPELALAAGGVGGLFRTTNGGESWSAVDSVTQASSMAFLPDGSRLVVGDSRGRVATSTNGGATWEAVLTLRDGDAITAIAAGTTPDSGAAVFAATASGRLFRSDDGGKSFVSSGEGLPDEEVRSLELSPDHAGDATLWASTWDSGVFRSTDRGETWEPMTDGLTTDRQADAVGVPQFRSLAAGIDARGQRSLFVGGFDGFFRYDERRSTWESVETLSDYVAGLTVSPDFANDKTIAVTTYVKGAFVSRDGGATWRSANDGLTVDDLGPGNEFAPLRRLHNVLFSPDYSTDGTIFSAHGVRIVKSTNRGASWQEIEVGPPPPENPLRQFVLAVSPAYSSDQTVFAATRQGEVYRSEGRGESGTWAVVGRFAEGERIRSLVVSPDYARDRVLYCGTVAGVYTSADGGATWHATGPRMATQPEPRGTDTGALVAISHAYDRDGTLFAGTDSGLFVTRDAGESWTEVTGDPLTPSSQIEAVAVSPDYHKDRTVLVSTREHGLLRSTDGGASFRSIGAELFDANHLVADFSNPTSMPIQFSPDFEADGTIFAYAQTHVIRSIDGGESWEMLNLPAAADVLDSLRTNPTTGSRAERTWFETPVGNLSVRRILVAAVIGVASSITLTVLGVGGRHTGRALASHLGGGIVVIALTLLVLAK